MQDLNPKFRDGPFALPVESIRAYVEAPHAAPRWIHVSSAGTHLPSNPGRLSRSSGHPRFVFTS